MPKPYQYRNHAVQLRIADTETEPTKIIGRAIVYNSLSRDLGGGYYEKFQPGAVSDSIKAGLVCALLNHRTEQPLGTQQAGTLKLIEDAQGVGVEIDIPDTSYARDAVALMKRGDGTGMSFGFYPTTEEWSKDANGLNVCTVIKAELGEVSVLTGVPAAYPATTAALRSLLPDADKYGIDLNKMAAVFCAIKRGLPLYTEELATLRAAKEAFGKVKYPALDAAIEKASKFQLI
jgi:uncharacterized protein